MKVAQNTRAYIFCALGLYAGLRREESLALTWLDVDWGKQLISIHNTVEFHSNQPKIVAMTKSAAGTRTIPIAPPLFEILERANPQHDDMGQMTVMYGKGEAHKAVTIISNMLCPSKAGDVMTKASYKRMWEGLTSRLSFYVTSHMLRHTYCTMLHSAGIDLRTAQYLMGHSDIRMTAKIYTHIEDKAIETAQQKINNIFSSQSNSQSSANLSAPIPHTYAGI